MKKCMAIFSYLILCFCLSGQQIIDTTLLQFNRKIDNQYIKDTYNVSNDYINRVYAIDINLYNDSYFYTAVIDQGYNVGFCLDDKRHADCFAYDINSQNRFLGYAGKVALTKSGRIYVVDVTTNEIFYWNKANLGFSPQGKINHKFSNIQDICCDEDDNIFILDISEKRIYKYSTTSNDFINFPQTDSYYSIYMDKCTSAWGQAAGLAVSDGNIYMIFRKSAILKLDNSGSFVKYFSINNATLGLPVGSTQTASDTWLQSITVDPYKNIYVLDTADKKIHIFTPDLEYICSWYDPNHLIGADATDMCFAPGSYSLYVAHSWGIYEFMLQPGICSIKVDESFLYPGCVNEHYRGVGIDVGFVGQGNTKIRISGQGREIVLLDRYSSYSEMAHHFKVYWNGKDNDGSSVPYGQYTIDFLFNDRVIKSAIIDVLGFPGVEILNSECVQINRSGILEYNYRVTKNGFLTISLSKPTEFNQVAWENEIDSIKITQGDHTERVTQTNLPDGCYGINFNILPPELALSQAKPITSTVYFTIDENGLALGDLALLATVFSPYSDSENTIGVNFSLNESALVSAFIYDANNNRITTLIDKQLFSDGTKTIKWNGYNSENRLVPGGNYYFVIQASPNGSSASPLQKQSSLFTLEVQPIKMTIQDQKPAYYISPREPSSFGIQDDLKLIVNFNREVTVSATITNSDEIEVKKIVSLVSVPKGTDLSLSWDGKNDASGYVPDGWYTLVINVSSALGEHSETRIPVIVDNNMSVDAINMEGIIGLTENQVDDVVTVKDKLSMAKTNGGYAIAWNDLYHDERHLTVFDDAGNIRRNQFIVRTASITFQWEYALSGTNDGFILIWLESDGILHHDVLYAQRFDDYGQEKGQKRELIRMTDSAYGIMKIVCKKTDNGYAVAWIRRLSGETINRLWIQFFNDADAALTPPRLIAENTESFVGLENDGNSIMAVWQTARTDTPGSYNLYVKKIEQNNPPAGDPLSIYTSDKAEATIKKLSIGFVVIGAFPNDHITAIQLDAAGNPTGKVIGIDNRYTYNDAFAVGAPSVIQTNDGFVVAWYDYNWHIIARRVDDQFSPVGNDIIINTSVDIHAFGPVLCPTNNGFNAAWLSGPDTQSVLSSKFKVIPPITGGNLLALISSPLNNSYPSGNVLKVYGWVNDANIDRYTLSLIDFNNNVTCLTTQYGKNISVYQPAAELYSLDLYPLIKGQKYTLKLEAWDKAGNYQKHNVDFFPQPEPTPDPTVEPTPEPTAMPTPDPTPGPTPVNIPLPTHIPGTLLGDVNLDGLVDILDALAVSQYITGQNPANFHPDNADVNLDWVIDSVDSMLIAQYYVGAIPSLPPPGTTPAPTTVPTPGPGAAWVLPVTQSVANGSTGVKIVVHVNTGTSLLATYGIDVTYNSAILGYPAVAAEATGFVSSYSTATMGTVTVAGFDTTGKGPSTDLALYNVTFTAIGTGTSAIGINNKSFLDPNKVDIGTKTGINGSITVN